MSNLILSVGSLLLFSTFLRTSLTWMKVNDQVVQQNEYYITAVSLAQAIIDEAKTKSYDQKTDTSGVTTPDSLTGHTKLGPDAGETIPKPDAITSASPYTSTSLGYRSTYKFNDVDDYRTYWRLVNTQRAEGFNINVMVNYVNETNPDVVSGSTPTFCKKMTVIVSSPYLVDASNANLPLNVVLSYVFSY